MGNNHNRHKAVKLSFPVLLILMLMLVITGCFSDGNNSTQEPAVQIDTSVHIITDSEREEEALYISESSQDAAETTEQASEETVKPEESEEQVTESEASDYTEYRFRNQKLLDNHYKKHGEEMGFPSAEAYEKAASDVVNNPSALHKKEKEDNDDVYYVEETNEFVIVSSDGYLRTYFYPDAGMKYYERQ